MDSNSSRPSAAVATSPHWLDLAVWLAQTGSLTLKDRAAVIKLRQLEVSGRSPTSAQSRRGGSVLAAAIRMGFRPDLPIAVPPSIEARAPAAASAQSRKPEVVGPDETTPAEPPRATVARAQLPGLLEALGSIPQGAIADHGSASRRHKNVASRAVVVEDDASVRQRTTARRNAIATIRRPLPQRWLTAYTASRAEFPNQYPPNATEAVPDLRNFLERVVDIEAPIHVELLYLRIATELGSRHVSPAVRANIDLALETATVSGRPVLRGIDSVCRVHGRTRSSARVSADFAKQRTILHVPDEELAIALAGTARDEPGSTVSQVCRLVIELFGWPFSDEIYLRLRGIVDTLTATARVRQNERFLEFIE